MQKPILTTHTGSLPLPPGNERLRELHKRRQHGSQLDMTEFADLADAAVDEIVDFQLRIGIDIVSNGEADRVNFRDTDRLSGFNGPETTALVPQDLVDAGMFGGFSAAAAGSMPRVNDGPVKHIPDAVGTELDRLLSALKHHNVDSSRTFMTVPSPGLIVSQETSFYDSDEEFLAAIISALREECLMIASAGVGVQIDAPDLAMDWFVWHHGQTRDEFTARALRHIDAINEVTEGITETRVHVCNGNWPGPHSRDAELKDILEIVYGALRPCTLLLELENPRHRHEAALFAQEQYRLPEHLRLGAGVVDCCSMNVGHWRTVADSLVRVALAAGPGAVTLATPDCGYKTFLLQEGSLYITEAHLQNLVRGTRAANDELAALEFGQ